MMYQEVAQLLLHYKQHSTQKLLQLDRVIDFDIQNTQAGFEHLMT